MCCIVNQDLFLCFTRASRDRFYCQPLGLWVEEGDYQGRQAGLDYYPAWRGRIWQIYEEVRGRRLKGGENWKWNKGYWCCCGALTTWVTVRIIGIRKCLCLVLMFFCVHHEKRVLVNEFVHFIRKKKTSSLLTSSLFSKNRVCLNLTRSTSSFFPSRASTGWQIAVASSRKPCHLWCSAWDGRTHSTASMGEDIPRADGGPALINFTITSVTLIAVAVVIVLMVMAAVIPMDSRRKSIKTIWKDHVRTGKQWNSHDSFSYLYRNAVGLHFCQALVFERVIHEAVGMYVTGARRKRFIARPVFVPRA